MNADGFINVRGCKSARGFTLIEVLIAISLTVLIGTIAYRFLDAALRVQEQSDTAQSWLQDMEQTWQLLAQDLQHSIDRPVVAPAVGQDPLYMFDQPSALPRPALLSHKVGDLMLSDLLGREGARLWLSRQAWANPAQQHRSTLQRVLYRLDSEGRLYRDYWPERNQLLSDVPEGSLLLMSDIQQLQIAFLPAQRYPDEASWLPHWPPSAADLGQVESPADAAASALPIRTLPAAIKVSLQLSGQGLFERIFLVSGS